MDSDMPRMRILLVDRHPIARFALKTAIESQTDLLFCGEADSRESAIASLPETHPQIVLTGINLVDCNGLELVKDLVLIYPELLILVVSRYDDEVYGERVLRAGARGYIGKSEPLENLIGAIRCIQNGNIYVNPILKSRLIKRHLLTARIGESSALNSLTDRELVVFHYIGMGIATDDIAAHTNLCEKSIEKYRASIRRKLNLRSTTAMIHSAARWIA